MKKICTQSHRANIPKLGQGEDPALYFPPPTKVIHMSRYKDPTNTCGWIKARKKELNTIIDSGSGNLNKKEQAKPTYLS
jgi:hypothetical protein